MLEQVVSNAVIDAADDKLLECVRTFVESRGGLTESVGGVELVLVSKGRFCLLVHCEGFPPRLPGALADG